MPPALLQDLAERERAPGELMILLGGDLVLDVEDPDHWLSGIAPAVRAADIAIGHLEVPHTRRGTELAGDVPAPPAAPEHLDALARAGFTAVTLAGNHIADAGPAGIEDTIARLDALGIAHAGAGPTLAAARAPAILECRGRRVALLSYNCVGPEAAWARPDRAGCNYLRIATADGAPVAPMAAFTDVTEEALWRLTDDIVAARGAADTVIVALHKGIVHTPAVLAPYEQALATAALAAGADIVVGHHAHILRGIEVNRGRPVFHGLGNACVVTRALDPAQAAQAFRLRSGSALSARAVSSGGGPRRARGRDPRCTRTAHDRNRAAARRAARAAGLCRWRARGGRRRLSRAHRRYGRAAGEELEEGGGVFVDVRVSGAAARRDDWRG